MKFSIFSESKNSFEGEKDYEKTNLLLRRHWFILSLSVFIFLILAAIPFVLYVVLGSYLEGLGLSSLFSFAVSIYFLIWWYGLFYKITMYLLDTWVVTDHRIVDSEQHGFFNRTVSELSLLRIQDVTVNISGFVQTFFDFGDLEIQTAGSENKFLFKQIANPNSVKDKIMAIHDSFLRDHPNGAEVHLGGEI